MSVTHETPLSVALIDVDYFKSVNDDHGHQVGDQVLVDIAKILASHSRRTDIVGRWGGEEFMLVIPNSVLEQSLAFAEKLRALIAAACFPGGERKTVSIGLASYMPGDDPNSLVNRTDEALYRAKNNGRNRVECQMDIASRT